MATNGAGPGRKRLSESLDLWAQELDPQTCWLWEHSTTSGGYGLIGVPEMVNGENVWHTELVHRFAYERFVGRIPPKMTVDHTCNAPLCWNPAHLKLATQRENILRGTQPMVRVHHTGMCAKGLHSIMGDDCIVRVRPNGTIKRRCHECALEYHRAWQQKPKNKARAKTYMREYYQRRKSL